MQTTFRFDIFSSGLQVILSFVAPWPLDTDVFVFFGKLLTENACLNRIDVLNDPTPANTLHIPTLPSYNCQLSGSLLHCKNLQQPESWSYKNEHLSLERRRRTRELDLVLLLEDLRLSCWM